MIDPLNALLAVSGGLFLLGFIFFPNKGAIAQWKRIKQSRTRVLLEDALKHVHDCEYKNISSTVQSVAGNLSIPVDKAAKLVTRLESMGLLHTRTGSLKLTPAGRSYALRIIRIHRLWEKYLADETGIQESEWHNRAEFQEHQMTSEETDALAAQLGNPVIDPHGDPIPTASGYIPSHKGVLLTSLKEGDRAQIIHIEDEPHAVYIQLVAEGLYPGMYVRMIESSQGRIKFEANGEECLLAPIFAANITVIPFEEKPEIEESFKSLSDLKRGEKAWVLGISKACRGLQRRRLMDLGIVPGTQISNEFKSVGGDPSAYLIRGATIALRKKQSNQIYVSDSMDKEEI